MKAISIILYLGCVNSVSDAFEFISFLVHIHSVTMPASLLRKYNQPNSNALQNPLNPIYGNCLNKISWLNH